jgi:hypothetical protein
MHGELTERIFDLDPAVRYVGYGEGQAVHTTERAGLAGASSADSDRFEELLVNPTLLTLARQHGELDCGGLRHVVVGYGNFTQLVVPTARGHVSIALERGADAEAIAERLAPLLAEHGLAANG